MDSVAFRELLLALFVAREDTGSSAARAVSASTVEPRATTDTSVLSNHTNRPCFARRAACEATNRRSVSVSRICFRSSFQRRIFCDSKLMMFRHVAGMSVHLETVSLNCT